MKQSFLSFILLIPLVELTNQKGAFVNIVFCTPYDLGALVS